MESDGHRELESLTLGERLDPLEVEAAPPAYDVVQYSYRLALIPDDLQGRVNSSFRLLAWGTRPIGALLAGFLLEWAGGPETACMPWAR